MQVKEVKLGIKENKKRKPVYDRDLCVDTDPIKIPNLSRFNHSSRVLIQSLRHEVLQQRNWNTKILSILDDRERELAEKDKKRYKDSAMILENEISIPKDPISTPTKKEENEISIPNKKERSTTKVEALASPLENRSMPNQEPP
ncbi:hypothetical protein HPP92_025993 [Vanilla planifolia]|uniref:Uncharacterized protein n=1 Tax=Vanilla planifolia TaxID=51239 RepID=A0A835PKI3_VANPL|nr:hypothetical protein HPP92_025993 [Vanilla planifolia]